MLYEWPLVDFVEVPQLCMWCSVEYKYLKKNIFAKEDVFGCSSLSQSGIQWVRPLFYHFKDKLSSLYFHVTNKVRSPKLLPEVDNRYKCIVHLRKLIYWIRSFYGGNWKWIDGWKNVSFHWCDLDKMTLTLAKVNVFQSTVGANIDAHSWKVWWF